MNYAIIGGEGTASRRERCISKSVMSTRTRLPPGFDAVDSASSTVAPGGPVLVNPQNIRRGMQVYDYDGTYVGFVTDVLAATLLLRRGWRAELEVPLEHVMAVLDQRVVLTVSLRAREGDRKAA